MINEKTEAAKPKDLAIDFGETYRQIAVELGYDESVDFDLVEEFRNLKQENDKLRDELVATAQKTPISQLSNRLSQAEKNALRDSILLDLTLAIFARKTAEAFAKNLQTPR